MSAIRMSSVIRFGDALGYLATVNEDVPIDGPGYLIENADIMLQYMEEFGLSEVELEQELDELFSRIKASGRSTPTAADIEQLRGVMAQVDRCVYAWGDRTMAMVSSSRILDAERLLAQWEGFFSPHALDTLPSHVKAAYKEAATCLALGLWLGAVRILAVVGRTETARLCLANTIPSDTAAKFAAHFDELMASAEDQPTEGTASDLWNLCVQVTNLASDGTASRRR